MVLNSEGQGLTVAAPGLNLVLPEMIVSYTFFRMAKPDSATVPVITGLPLKTNASKQSPLPGGTVNLWQSVTEGGSGYWRKSDLYRFKISSFHEKYSNIWFLL